MKKFDIFIRGRAVPKARPRMGRRGLVYTPARSRAWEKVVRDEALLALLSRNVDISSCLFVTECIAVSLHFNLHDKRRADLDNLMKSVLDALQSLVYRDDSQIVEIHARVTRDKSREQGVAIEICEVQS